MVTLIDTQNGGPEARLIQNLSRWGQMGSKWDPLKYVLAWPFEWPFKLLKGPLKGHLKTRFLQRLLFLGRSFWVQMEPIQGSFWTLFC